MIYIPIIIIIIIISIDIYIKFYALYDTFTEKTDENINKMIEYSDPKPWNKIYFGEINKYYIYIKDVNMYINTIISWKNIPQIKQDSIDVDIENNYLIIKSNDEKEALVITNLIISMIMNDITLTEIIDKNIINLSLEKARKYSIVVIKLRELIIDSVNTLNKKYKDILDIETIDTNNIIEKPIKIKKKVIAQVNKPETDYIIQEVPFDRFTPPIISKVIPYEGSEFASVNYH